jgi:SAM-dependent methyltransferase
MQPDDLEISDLIVDYDPESLRRRPVPWRPVVEYFQSRGDRSAARIVRSLPRNGDLLDEEGVDRILLLSHMELQRLEEEFLHGQRILDLVRAMVRTAELHGLPKPFRVVDIGCGLGYLIRWLTCFGGLGPDVELVGVDYNGRLIRAAQALAEEEGLRCRFEAGAAERLATPATFYFSSGVLHHFRGPSLLDFFARQRATVTGFVHMDIRPSSLTPFGAWLYHRARMRQPLARHDGTLSAVRAHSAATLMEAARISCPGLCVHVDDRGTLPVFNVFHSLVGVRPELEQTLLAELTRRKAMCDR